MQFTCMKRGHGLLARTLLAHWHLHFGSGRRLRLASALALCIFKWHASLTNSHYPRGSPVKMGMMTCDANNSFQSRWHGFVKSFGSSTWGIVLVCFRRLQNIVRGRRRHEAWSAALCGRSVRSPLDLIPIHLQRHCWLSSLSCESSSSPATAFFVALF